MAVEILKFDLKGDKLDSVRILHFFSIRRVCWVVQIMVISTTLFLAAGRFGVAPTANKTSTAGLKLVAQNPGLKSGDPAGQLSFSPAFPVPHAHVRMHAQGLPKRVLCPLLFSTEGLVVKLRN